MIVLETISLPLADLPIKSRVFYFNRSTPLAGTHLSLSRRAIVGQWNEELQPQPFLQWPCTYLNDAELSPVQAASSYRHSSSLEQAMGIEPTLSDWKSDVLTVIQRLHLAPDTGLEPAVDYSSITSFQDWLLTIRIIRHFYIKESFINKL